MGNWSALDSHEEEAIDSNADNESRWDFSSCSHGSDKLGINAPLAFGTDLALNGDKSRGLLVLQQREYKAAGSRRDGMRNYARNECSHAQVKGG